jgi:hypothetical protein
MSGTWRSNKQSSWGHHPARRPPSQVEVAGAGRIREAADGAHVGPSVEPAAGVGRSREAVGAGRSRKAADGAHVGRSVEPAAGGVDHSLSPELAGVGPSANLSYY